MAYNFPKSEAEFIWDGIVSGNGISSGPNPSCVHGMARETGIPSQGEPYFL